MSTVTLTWDEPASHYGIDPKMVEKALEAGVREHLLNDEEFRVKIGQVIESAGKEVTRAALEEVFKNALVDAFKDKIAAQRAELVQCLRDFQSFRTQHASEYADRRYKELLKRFDELDAM